MCGLCVYCLFQGLTGAEGDILQLPVKSDNTSILEVSLLPLESKGKVALAGLQIFSTEQCSMPTFTGAQLRYASLSVYL